MSNIKFSPNLFLGKQELDRFKKFIDEDGFRKIYLQNMESFGLFNNSKLGAFDNFKVEQGTNAGTIKHAAGIAVDVDGELIVRSATDNIEIADDNAWYWVKIAHVKVNVEVGTVTVDASGNLTGVGTLFEEVLRGSPNNAVKVSFPGATNSGEYEVLSVTDDTTAILSGGAGTFGVEADLQYVVTGAFAPDATPTAGEKDIYEYDSTTFTVVAETVAETAPAATLDEEFYLARVRNNAGVISIYDVRTRYIAKEKFDYNGSLMDTVANPCIGVESIKNDHNFTPRERNLVYMSWGFRSSTWSMDLAINQVTLASGNGGVFKSVTDLTDGDFDGWRLYAENGTYTIIRTSALVGGAIKLNLDSMDFVNFANASQQLLVVPNVEGITIKFIPDAGTYEDIALTEFSFPINLDVVKLPVIGFANPSSSYVVKYKYKNGLEYGLDTLIPTDVVGYLDESSWNDDGSAGTPNAVPYTAHATVGFITLTIGSTAYVNQINTILKGDKLGVTIITPSDLNPITVLTPTVSDREYWWVPSSVPFVLGVNHFIDLSTVGVSDGNTFTITFQKNFALNSNTFKVVTGYISAGTPGTTVLDLTQDILYQGNPTGPVGVTPRFSYKFTYDAGTGVWLYTQVALDSLPRIPTTDQKAALVGASGTPSSSNKYLTEADKGVLAVAWTVVTPLNGWTTTTGAYCKDMLGFVHLRGSMDGTSATSALMFDLPIGVRPSSTADLNSIPVIGSDNGTLSNDYRVFESANSIYFAAIGAVDTTPPSIELSNISFYSGV